MQSFPLPERNGCKWPGPVRFSFGALRALEKENRIGVRKLFADTLDFEGITLLLTYGLRHAAPSITPDETSDMIDQWCEHGGAIEDLMPTVIEALSASGILRGGKKSPTTAAAAPPLPAAGDGS